MTEVLDRHFYAKIMLSVLDDSNLHFLGCDSSVAVLEGFLIARYDTGRL